jgi:hypothetical protein
MPNSNNLTKAHHELNFERLTAESKCRFAEESAELSCPAYVGAEQGSNLEGENLSG